MPFTIGRSRIDSQSEEEMLALLMGINSPIESTIEAEEYSPNVAMSCLQREAIIYRQGDKKHFIGSAGFATCVAFIAKNEAGDILFAHIDSATEFDVATVLAKLKGKTIEISLVGGYEDEENEHSKGTLKRILSSLKNYASTSNIDISIKEARVLSKNHATQEEEKYIERLKRQRILEINNNRPNYYKDFVINCLNGKLILVTPPSLDEYLTLRQIRQLENKKNNPRYDNNTLLIVHDTHSGPEQIILSAQFVQDFSVLRKKKGNELYPAMTTIFPTAMTLDPKINRVRANYWRNEAKKINKCRKEAEMLRQTAYEAENRGEHEVALINFKKSIYIRLAIEGIDRCREQAKNLGKEAHSAYRRKKYVTALAKYKEALTIRLAIEENENIYVATLNYNMGCVYLDMNNSHEAFIYLARALEISASIDMSKNKKEHDLFKKEYETCLKKVKPVFDWFLKIFSEYPLCERFVTQEVEINSNESNLKQVEKIVTHLWLNDKIFLENIKNLQRYNEEMPHTFTYGPDVFATLKVNAEKDPSLMHGIARTSIEFAIIVGTKLQGAACESYLKLAKYAPLLTKSPLNFNKLNEAIATNPQLALDIYYGKEPLKISANGKALIGSPHPSSISHFEERIIEHLKNNNQQLAHKKYVKYLKTHGVFSHGMKPESELLSFAELQKQAQLKI